MWQEICGHCLLKTVHILSIISKRPQSSSSKQKTFVNQANRRKVEEVKDKAINQLKKAPGVCLINDLWSNRQLKSFTGITGRYMKDLIMKLVMIACKRFEGICFRQFFVMNMRKQ